MPTSGHSADRVRRTVRWVALAAPLWAFGCSDGVDKARAGNLGEADALRLGRVHVVLEPTAETDARLQVTARFAFVQGLEEDFVRARIDMPMLSQDLLSPGQCTVDDAYPSAADGEIAGEPRELVLIDAGELRVNVGASRVRVPLSLVPDLLPYMSGVEYVYYGESAPNVADGGVLVEADGSQTDELPPFSVEGQLPAALDLSVSDADLAELERDALVMHWQSASDGTVAVRLTPLVSGEPAGDDITCLFADRGQARLDLSVLRTLGLPPNADGLRLTGSRITSTTFDAGDFNGSELVVERRSRVSIPLP